MEFLKGVFSPGGADREIRRQMIKEMHERLPEVAKMERGKYTMILRNPNGQVNTLSICLIASFPTVKPIFSVRGPLQHPWIDQYRFVTGSNTLNTWDPKNSSLADAIFEVREALECGYELNEGQSSRSSGSVVQQQQQQQQHLSLSNPSAESANPVVETVETSVSTSENNSALAMFTPAVPSEFPKLQELTEVQLMRLLDDEIAFEHFVADQEGDVDMKKMHQTICSNNVKVARDNLRREAELTKLHKEVNELQDQLQLEMRKYQESLSTFTKDHALNRDTLVKGVEKLCEDLDLESMDYGDLFVNGETPMTEFLKEYRQKRIRYHSLQAKLEALDKAGV